MKDKLDSLLEHALAPMELPEKKLNDQILRKVKEKKDMKQEQVYYKRRIPAAALITVCMLILCSSTALAVYRYLSPAEVATETNDNALQKAFLGEDAILVNETQESGGYKVTLIGSVAGKNISDFLMKNGKGEVLEDRIYTIITIERADGTPMPDTSSDEYGEESFFASHYIHGLDPNVYSMMSMNGSYTEFVNNGVQYRILDMDNIEMFADRGIYVGVNSGTFYDRNAYSYNESTGEMSCNESYTGVNVLFQLPMDVRKADPSAAEAYLKAFEESMNEPDETPEKSELDMQVDEFMEMLTPENIDEYAEPVESTRQVCTIDENGWPHYSYELDTGAAEDGVVLSDLEGKQPGSKIIEGWSYSDSGLDDLNIDVLILNEDGTITFVLYQPRQELLYPIMN
ncbi:MAG: hypothetical protein K2N73_00150 [Lachnospiraceae bacterium]|nr:hypothetical protein [Lachnospiraceae bacterium]